MPSVKQGGGYTLTFSKKNQDVKRHLDNLKKDGKVKITDYLCEAVRFFEDNKNAAIEKSNLIDHIDIDKIIEEKIKALIGNTTQIIEKDIVEEEIDPIYNLEDGYGVDDEDLEED